MTSACDAVLNEPDLSHVMMANPYLHVLSEHPVCMQIYRKLLPCPGEACINNQKDSRFVGSVRTRLEAVSTYAKRFGKQLKRKRNISTLSGTYDALIVSWLTNEEHLSWTDDFYFGAIQSALSQQGYTSLLLLGNISGAETVHLKPKALKQGTEARLLLDDVFSVKNLLRHLIAYGIDSAKLAASAFKKKGMERRVRAGAFSPRSVPQCLRTMSIHDQIRFYCERHQPKVIFTLYEGHALERLIWRAARKANPNIICVGYQHTVIRKHAHSMKRLLQKKQYNPDVVLTIGEHTRKLLQQTNISQGADIQNYGTHRINDNGQFVNSPSPSRAVLVLPEGLQSECILLFRFMVACAEKMPHTTFIYRTHPVLPFTRIRASMNNVKIPGNIDISREKTIEKDYAKAGVLLYRGSSTVMYAILSGLKPFYISDGSMDIDPIYDLDSWREAAQSANDFNDRYYRYFETDKKATADEWNQARLFCHSYLCSNDDTVLQNIMEKAS